MRATHISALARGGAITTVLRLYARVWGSGECILSATTLNYHAETRSHLLLYCYLSSVPHTLCVCLFTRCLLITVYTMPLVPCANVVHVSMPSCIVCLFGTTLYNCRLAVFEQIWPALPEPVSRPLRTAGPVALMGAGEPHRYRLKGNVQPLHRIKLQRACMPVSCVTRASFSQSTNYIDQSPPNPHATHTWTR